MRNAAVHLNPADSDAAAVGELWQQLLVLKGSTADLRVVILVPLRN